MQNEEKATLKEYLRRKCMIKPPVETDPRLIAPKKKSAIIACVALVACTAGFSSTIYFPGLPYITKELNAPEIATTLTASLFVLCMGIAPVCWASISEHFHIRRFIFLVAMIIYMATSLGGAFVQNIWALVAVRCIQSIGVSSAQSVGAGYISDLYPVETRGAAFGKYMFGVICGPLLGPIIGGFLIMSALTWRATFWFCFAFGIFIFLVTFFFTPETYRDNERFDAVLPTTSVNEKVDTVPQKEEQHDDNESTNETVGDTASERTVVTIVEPEKKKKKKMFNPFAAFALLRHPFILISSITAGFFFGAMFATEAILPNAFSEVYGLTAWQTGLCYLGAGIGNLSGSVVGSRLSDRLLLRSRRLRGGATKSEDRLTMNIWIAGFVFNPLGLLIFGWVVQHKLSYWGAIIGFGIQCFGNVQVITTITAYLVDSVPGRGASATAAANFVRFAFSCILSAISTPMINGLGPGWTCTLFACLSVLGMVLMVILKIWGEPIRRFSGF